MDRAQQKAKIFGKAGGREEGGSAMNQVGYATGFGTAFSAGIQKVLATRATS